MPTRHRPNTKAAQAAATQADPRWAAVVERSTGADGTFWYSVQTTGVYCRPSCASRTPRPENVLFHTSCDEAEPAGPVRLGWFKLPIVEVVAGNCRAALQCLGRRECLRGIAHRKDAPPERREHP
eukprot:gene45598-biopygen31503